MKGLLFTYLLTFGGGAVSLVRPFVGLLIFVCFAILRPEALWHWSVPAGNYSRIVAVALLVGWLVNGGGNWRFGSSLAVLLPLMAFWAWLALGATQAEIPDAAWARLESMSKTFLPFLVGLTLLDSVQKVKQLAWVIVLSQGYLAFELNLTYLAGAFNALEFDHGTMDNNAMAIAMVAGTGFAFFLGLGAERWWQKATAFACALFMAHFVLFSMSRGGMLSLILTGAASFLLIPKRTAHYVVFFLAVAVMVRLAGPEVMKRFESTFAAKEERDRSAESRLQYWAAAWNATTQNPVFGLGPDQWRFRCPEYGIQLGRAVHSTWLQVSAEHGFAGLLLLALFYGLAVTRLWPLARGSVPVPDPALNDLARMVIASVIGFVISAQFVTMHGVDAPYFIVLVGAGALKVYSAAASPDPAFSHPYPLAGAGPARYQPWTPVG